jgi:hypothetical protein
VFVVLLAVVLGAPALHAQRLPNQLRAAMRPKPLRGHGQLLAIRPGLMQVQGDDGQVWLMKIEATPDQVRVQGTAVAGWLKPGMWIRFSGTLDSAGVAQSPIQELFVFTPHPGLQIGVFPEVEPLGEDAAEQPAAKRTRRRRGALSEGRYLVAGRITSMRDDELRVTAGNGTVRAKVAEHPNIRVDMMGDYRFAKSGDQVDYVGRFYETGKALVTEVTFTATTPFGGEAQAAAREKGDRGRQRRDATREGRGAKSSDAGSAADDNPRQEREAKADRSGGEG